MVVAGQYKFRGNNFFNGTPTSSDQAKNNSFLQVLTKKECHDFSDAAYFKSHHKIQEVLGGFFSFSSQNDAADGIAFLTHASSQIKHNSNTIWTQEMMAMDQV
jgi:hypothetical protein